ncbi:MAG: Fe-S metabolism protein SufE [Ignavibacteriae bacterium HGW-Ignavibacteriae-2]|jgi:cysteine desulfuration protein SufE|nr:MAG: Fe-S metabolism protein SufE [Ignavibacteriae bacterium HGW-Ignavibacteriae-2]
MNIKETHEYLIKEFDEFDNWDDRYAHIIKLGRKLPEFPEEFRTDKNKIEGCQSQVWMNAKFEHGRINLVADSDAMIVKGLIAVLLRAYSGFSPSDVLASPPDFIKKIGIDNHLSPTRKNGLGAMLKQIQMYAVAFKALTGK